ncbi:MAG: helix-turn-helix domain-containing protein [Chloroflexi bacterium]|nr:helix-turn-helix domain-containing protein [Chloroflexota bacterium]
MTNTYASESKKTSKKINKMRYFQQLYKVNIGCPIEKAILFYLIWRANPDNYPLYSYPSAKTIARETDSSVKTVRRKLKSLEIKGYIETRTRHLGGRQTSNMYIINDFMLRDERKSDLEKMGEAPDFEDQT